MTIEPGLGFEHILIATLRMLRTSWQAPVSLFLQIDDAGDLQLRAADGFLPKKIDHLSASKGVLSQCITNNRVMEADLDSNAEMLGTLVPSHLGKQKVVLVPVLGQVKVLGVLILGPFDQGQDVLSRESELRSAGALCAVLSAHWRLYEWMSEYLVEVNHELRTPLTAVQGSLGMVLGGVCGQVGGEVKQMLEMAQKGCERTVRAIEGFLNKQQPPKSEEK